MPGEPDILIVDDDPVQLRAMRRVLGSRYAVRTVETAPEALVEATRKVPDVVILDYLLGPVDGLMLARSLRNGGFRGRLIVLTGHLELPEAAEPIATGVVDQLLHKPWTQTELEEAISRSAPGTTPPAR